MASSRVDGAEVGVALLVAVLDLRRRGRQPADSQGGVVAEDRPVLVVEDPKDPLQAGNFDSVSLW